MVRSEFFLSELLARNRDAAGFIVELMRSASHIQDFRKLFAVTSPPETEDFDELAKDLQNDSLRILIMNFAASQMRESLKLFAAFSRSSAFKRMRRRWPKEQEHCAQDLEECVNQFDKKTGLLYLILKPLRDRTFHYDPDAAKQWAEDRMRMEEEPKPPFSSVDFNAKTFGPGIEHDESLYSQFLFWNGPTSESLLKAQTEVWELQLVFLKFVEGLTKALIEDAGIPTEREFGWCLKYRYGFKPPRQRLATKRPENLPAAAGYLRPDRRGSEPEACGNPEVARSRRRKRERLDHETAR